MIAPGEQVTFLPRGASARVAAKSQTFNAHLLHINRALFRMAGMSSIDRVYISACVRVHIAAVEPIVSVDTPAERLGSVPTSTSTAASPVAPNPAFKLRRSEP